MNVLSLFDGMSCGQVALNRIGITPTKYYASEIDKHAIKVAQHNFPNTIQLGDVNLWESWDMDWKSIDLLMGGFPCQAFSLSGKRLAFDDPRGKLFFECVKILNHIRKHNPNVKFLFENVQMKNEHLEAINNLIGIKPMLINSKLLAAQSRPRNYWFNWEVSLPEDKNIVLKDILEDSVDEKFFINDCRNVDYPPYPASIVGRRINSKGVREDYNKNVPITQCLQVKNSNDKTGTLTTVQKDNVIAYYPSGRYVGIYDRNDIAVRILTPLEYERLQTLDEGYTDVVSNNQRYKMLGNGWTVDVISHILTPLK